MIKYVVNNPRNDSSQIVVMKYTLSKMILFLID